jgi:hypothetical protein
MRIIGIDLTSAQVTQSIVAHPFLLNRQIDQSSQVSNNGRLEKQHLPCTIFLERNAIHRIEDKNCYFRLPSLIIRHFVRNRGDSDFLSNCSWPLSLIIQRNWPTKRHLLAQKPTIFKTFLSATNCRSCQIAGNLSRIRGKGNVRPSSDVKPIVHPSYQELKWTWHQSSPKTISLPLRYCNLSFANQILRLLKLLSMSSYGVSTDSKSISESTSSKAFAYLSLVVISSRLIRILTLDLTQVTENRTEVTQRIVHSHPISLLIASQMKCRCWIVFQRTFLNQSRTDNPDRRIPPLAG